MATLASHEQVNSDQVESQLDQLRGVSERLEAPEPIERDRKDAHFIETTATRNSDAHEIFRTSYYRGLDGPPPKNANYVSSDALVVLPLLRAVQRNGMQFVDLCCGVGVAVACAQVLGFKFAAGFTPSKKLLKEATKVCSAVADHFGVDNAPILIGDPASKAFKLDRPREGVDDGPELPTNPTLYFYRIGSANLGHSPHRQQQLLSNLRDSSPGSFLLVHRTFTAETFFDDKPDLSAADLFEHFGEPVRVYGHGDGTVSALYGIKLTEETA